MLSGLSTVELILISFYRRINVLTMQNQVCEVAYLAKDSTQYQFHWKLVRPILERNDWYEDMRNNSK